MTQEEANQSSGEMFPEDPPIAKPLDAAPKQESAPPPPEANQADAKPEGSAPEGGAPKKATEVDLTKLPDAEPTPPEEPVSRETDKKTEGEKEPVSRETDGQIADVFKDMDPDVGKWLTKAGYHNAEDPMKEAAKSLFHLQKVRGAPNDFVKKLPDDPSDDDVKTYHKSIGAPEEVGGYELPDGVDKDDPYFKGLSEAAYQGHVTAEAWNGLRGTLDRFVQEARENSASEYQTALQNFQTSDPKTARIVAQTMGSSGVDMDLFNRVVTGDSVKSRAEAALEMVSSFGSVIAGEGSTPFSDKGGTQGAPDFVARESADAIQEKIEAMRNNSQWKERARSPNNRTRQAAGEELAALHARLRIAKEGGN